MENNNFEDTRDTEMIDAMKRIIYNATKEFVLHREIFQSKKGLFETLSSQHDSILEKREPSNEQAFLRISGGLQVMSEHMATMESKLSHLQDEIQFLKTILDSTSENLAHLFPETATRAVNLIKEVSVVGKRVDIEIDVIDAFRIVHES